MTAIDRTKLKTLYEREAQRFVADHPKSAALYARAQSPRVVAEAVARRVKEGITFMLPTEDALWVGEDLQRRFRLPYWQFALTATDANRFSIRIAREITQRSKILVFHYCYHGTVDESFAR